MSYLNTSVLIYSCDAYSDVWGPFFKLFFKYWECPYRVYITAETKRCYASGVTTINTEGTWTERMQKAVREIPTKYVIGMCEDFFLRKRVKQQTIENCLLSMKEDASIACFNFEKDYDGAKGGNVLDFSLKPPGHSFQKSCQPTLWRKSILSELLDVKLDPWKWEDSPTTEKYKFYVYTGSLDGLTFDYGLYKRNKFGIVQGKWYEADVGPLFKREGINIDLSIRGTI